MMRAGVLLGALVMAACGGGAEPEPAAEPEAPATAGTIERLDPALDALVPADAVIEELAGGFGFTEGPAWIDDDGGFLLFSDIPGNRIVKWAPDETISDFLNPVYEGEHEEGRLVGSNGITVDADGNVVFTEHFNGRISRVAADGMRSVVVDSYDGGRLNSPNDLDYHSDGSLYFTDPPYGLPSPEAREQDANGIYRLSPDGELVRLAEQTGPNGIAFSPDESLLYVADSSTQQWMAYPVAEDGTLGEAELLLDASGSEEERRGRRPEGRRAGQPVGDRSRRRLGHRAGRAASRHHQAGPGPGQRGVGRRGSAHAVHDRPHRAVPHSRERGRRPIGASVA